MGGHAGGDVASSLAIGELAPLDDESHGADALDHLSQAVRSAHRELLERVDEEPALAGMGTTVTALLRSGNRLALAHIGDSRAYLLRDAQLVQITKDHTFVQTLVDEGRLTPTEAEHHPQRSVLMRVLSDVVDDVDPDLSMREARIGDRYLLCSDGLSGVVSFDTLRDTLAAGVEPATTCEALVQLALRAGAPDNVTCIIADIIDDAVRGDSAPFVVGAASIHQPRRGLPGAQGSAAERAAALTLSGEADEEASHGEPANRRRLARVSIAGALAVAVLIGGGFAAWSWVQSQLFVGAAQGAVAIFTGLPQDLGPVRLSRVSSVAPDVQLTSLPDYARAQINKGIPADNDADAQSIVARMRVLADSCRRVSASPSATIGTAVSASGTALAGPTAAGPSGTALAGPTPTGAAATGVVPTTSPTGAPVTPAASAVASPTGSVTDTLTPDASGGASGSASASPGPTDCGPS